MADEEEGEEGKKEEGEEQQQLRVRASVMVVTCRRCNDQGWIDASDAHESRC